MLTKLEMAEADCSTLLYRALYERTVVAFGEDGLGQYGRNPTPKTFKIVDIQVDLEEDPSAYQSLMAEVRLYLSDYSISDCGAVATDENLRIAINNLLRLEEIDPACWTWASYDLQGENFCTILVDVEQLLQW